MFPTISPKQSFPALESEVLAYWKANNTFQKSIDSRPASDPYRFYDGPPFITGTPHYGSLLSSIVKDVVGRYWTMRGKRVDRVWGWDCHGLPIEEKVQKKLGLSSNKEIEERGVKEFIDGCYEYTAATSAEWDWYIDKIGRWVDMDHAYRTMDQDYMESVMWVFRQLWDKGLIYEGKRVSLYSWKLGTPISNFEVAMDDTYQEVNDPAITVKFELELNDRFPEETKVLAWTTTPWTIPANMALAVRNDIEYILVQYSGEYMIIAKNRAETVFKGKGEYMVEREFTGVELVGLTYTPPFPEYYHTKHGDRNHRIYHADFITDTDGTGIGHEAPEFGDVDFQLAKKEGIYISEAMDEAGKYTSQIHDYEGLHYQEANTVNIERMKANNTLFKLEGITHRVPFCPRSATPLVQKAQKSWFIDIQSQKEKLLEANKSINWFPEHLKFGRFAKGIESAPDWCISRTRYWGAPMPVWQNRDGSERVVVSSREEIYEMNKSYGQLEKREVEEKTKYFFLGGEFDGVEFNLHKPYIDSVFLAPGFSKMTNVLAIHGKESDINGDNWNERRKIFREKGIELCMHQFDRSVDPSYESWKTTFDTIDFSAYHTVYTSSLGGQMTALYLAEKGIRVPRIVMSAPGMGYSTEKGECHNLSKMWEILDKKDLRGIADEIFIFHAKDDDGVPFRNGEKFAKQLGARLIPFENGGHTLWEHLPIIGEYIKYGKERKVLGVHGYCRHESVADFLEGARKNLAQEGVHMDAPVFQKGEHIDYLTWNEKLQTLDLASYDTILTHSLGGRVVMNYLIENEISLDRLVMVAPGMDSTTKEVQGFYDSLEADVSELKKYVSEIVVLASRDDVGREGKAKALAELVGARYIEVSGYGHFNHHECKLIEGLVLSGEPLVRIREVLDVWMDSGSMPYAQMHYPFENKGEMEASFPADFIAEYVGQVRAWFYVMHVLGVLLNPNNEPKPTPSFTNVITTGVINGNDGRKMSKSYGNYPDPRLTIEKYGADPIRFYMLNSPLLSGGDMDFKEEQIIETVKGVMLPIWNTYSFFTTYANIDGWKKDQTEITFVRHAETDNNASGRVNGGGIDTDITENGILQAKSRGETFRTEGKSFDVIVTTAKKRTKQTAEIIAREIRFDGIWEEMDAFGEQKMGKYEGRTHAEIQAECKEKTGSENGWVAYYRNNEEENYADFAKRILSAYEGLKEKYVGKRILIVAHGGTARVLRGDLLGMDIMKNMIDQDSRFHNCEAFVLPDIRLVNDLDRWILSKLQVLLGQVHDAMDGYDVSRACRAIVEYMDHMTNWYVRLSRRRFWESGMTADKKSAYSTLHTVLVELSKLLAPYMPFISEDIFRGLTGKESVHLEYVTRPTRHLVDNDLNRDMERCENIVSLGLALRSRENIRVRQPLQYITITTELDLYYQNIIRDELNVKEVRFEDPEKLAKKICKPDARKIGPRFGKDVQAIISLAKNGDFTELSDGKIQVGNFILESGEYVLEYLPLEGVGDVIGGNGMVVALDTTITEELKLEGYARDIIRLIQDMRKDADYNVTDRISLSIIGEESDTIKTRFGDMITGETLSTLVDQIDAPDTIREEAIDEDNVIQIAIKR